MGKRVTIKDISQEMGVSVTTVFKALNNKPKISEEMRKKISDKAREMNYTPNKLAQGLARATCNLGIIVPREPKEFFTYVERGINEAILGLLDYNIHCIVKEVSTEAEAREAVRSLIRKDVAGIIVEPNEVICGIYTHLEDTSLLKAPVISFVTEPIDQTPLLGVLRSNGYILGRIAAQLLHRCVGDGKVVVFWPEGKTLIHGECGSGFIGECKLRGMGFVSCIDITNRQDVAYDVTGDVLKKIPDLRGIYVASYNAVGVCKRLEDMGRTDVRVIGQDLYPALVACLERGSLEATLFQNQYHLAKEAIALLFEYVTGKKEPFGTRFHRPEIVMRTNLECYKGMY